MKPKGETLLRSDFWSSKVNKSKYCVEGQGTVLNNTVCFKSTVT